MGKKDSTEKQLEDYNDVFSDIVNVLLFDGKEVVKPDELFNIKDRSQFKADDGTLHEQERDVFKLWKDKAGFRIAFFGFENQTKPDRDMPLRVISYDGASYKSQLLGNEGDVYSGDTGKRIPVITIVLYFGTSRWNNPVSLYDCFGTVPEELKRYVNDYRINLFEVSFMKDEEIGKFKSDFSIIADFFSCAGKNREYVPSAKAIKHTDAFLKLMAAATGDDNYVLARKDGGETNMCSILQGYREEGLKEGKLEGLKEGLKEGKLEGLKEGRIVTLYHDCNKSPEEIADIVKCPLEYVMGVIKNHLEDDDVTS